jgi:hypothetical protein
MGSSASIIEQSDVRNFILEQRLKPLNGDDIVDLEVAKAEIIKYRAMCHSISIEGSNNSDSQTKHNNVIITNLRIKLDNRSLSLQEAFNNLDIKRTGYITQEEFLNVSCVLCSCSYM